jgi:ribosomal protein S21
VEPSFSKLLLQEGTAFCFLVPHLCKIPDLPSHGDVPVARILKKKVQKSGMTRELRRRRYYEKPSERRRRQKREGIKNTRKRELSSR